MTTGFITDDNTKISDTETQNNDKENSHRFDDEVSMSTQSKALTHEAFRDDKIYSHIQKAIESKFSTQIDGNISTQFIFNIDQMMGDITSIKADRIAKSKKSEKNYKLYDRLECSEFVDEYKNSLHFAYAVSISLFEYVPVSSLQILSEHLMRRLPMNLNEKGDEDNTFKNPFISLDTILSIIGAETCLITYKSCFENVCEKCVYFPEYHDKVMTNFWEMFPLLRNQITSWLIESYSTACINNGSFKTKCFINAMVNIIKLDFSDSLNRLFIQLTSNPSNKNLLTALLFTLINGKDTNKNASELLRQWSSSHKWLWEIPFVIFSDYPSELSFASEIETTLHYKILNSLEEENDRFFGLISGKMMTSLKLRTMVSKIFRKIFAETIEKSLSKVQLTFLMFVSYSYSFVNKNKTNLPLITFDNRQQAENINPIIISIISDYNKRHILFDVLKAYIEEINDYEIPDLLLNGLKSFFYIISKNSPKYFSDILRFLKNIKNENKVANEIAQFLHEKIIIRKELITL